MRSPSVGVGAGVKVSKCLHAFLCQCVDPYAAGLLGRQHALAVRLGSCCWQNHALQVLICSHTQGQLTGHKHLLCDLVSGGSSDVSSMIVQICVCKSTWQMMLVHSGMPLGLIMHESLLCNANDG